MNSSSPFPSLQSKIDLASQECLDNRDSWNPVLERFERSLLVAASEGNELSIERHRERGQLTARDRISLLLDHDSPFLELAAFAGHEITGSSACASLVAGIGSVCGRQCLIMSHIPTLSGGAWNQITVLKQSRVMEIGAENNLPLISLVQSFSVFHKGGELFRDLALRSQRNQQSCAVVFGSCTAGGAYHPALSDYTIFVEDQAQVFLAGPPLVEMATGEVVQAEELGGAKIHSTMTGLADALATDEFAAITMAREWVSTLSEQDIPKFNGLDMSLPPRYSPKEITSIVNPDVRRPFDMYEVLLRIVDDSRLSIFKPEYGRNMITAWTRITGHLIGVVANQTPIINPDEANKGTQFIRQCNQLNVPIVFFHNVTGFMVGTKAEHAGIIKKGAQLVSAVSCSTVPHISIIMGSSYGAGNYAMCGRAYKPRFLFSWPTSRCSVMGPEQLSGVMRTIQIASAKSKAIELSATQLDDQVKGFRADVERKSESYSTSAVCLDDGIIDPRDTRDVLGMCLETVKLSEVRGSSSHAALARI